MFQRPCRHWQRGCGFCAVALLATVVTFPGNAFAASPEAAPLRAASPTMMQRDTASASPVLVSESIQTEPGAAWVRLRFDEVAFPGFKPGDIGYLKLTSQFDGAVQILDAVDFERWHRRSAYFNGDTIRIEAYGTAPSSSAVIHVAEVRSGFADDAAGGAAPRTICGTLDDRLLSAEPRVARIVLAEGDFPDVCTAAIISDANRCFFTSGGCAGALDVDTVIEFNAPLTFPNGTTLNHPSPDDQYVPDLTSVQNETGDAGSDWGYFGCFDNSNTGLSPAEAQGGFFTLAESIPAPDNQNLTMYGHGYTVPPVFRSWSFVTKEVDGPFVGQTGDALAVRLDGTPGDSGGAVVLASSGEYLGILVDDGCTSVGGSNFATSVLSPNLRKALAQPMGVCVPISFSFIGGHPEFVSPNGGATLQVIVSGANGTTPTPDSGLFHYNDGSGWVTVAMTEVAPNQYEAVFAPTACGNFIDYYVSVETSLGVRFPDQISNPVVTFRTVAATGITQLAAYDFEDVTGWTIQDVNVTAGGWAHGMPDGDGNMSGPDADSDGSGQCWATGLADNVDLDGGPARLRSPTFDLSAASNPFLTYDAWFTTDDPVLDKFAVQYSDSGGLFWDTVVEFGDQGPGWVTHRHRIADLGNLTSGVRFRFTATDLPNNSETEAGLDAMTIIDYECDGVVTCTKGDLNNDSLRDGDDIAGMANALLNAPMSGTVEFCAADMDNDGTIELTDDLQSFVQCLLTGNCP